METKDADAILTLNKLLPPKPEEPLDSECCGTGCTPCVFDIYKEKIKKWELDCERLRNGLQVEAGLALSDYNSILSPFEYGNFIVTEIIEDCLFCKIIRFQKWEENESEMKLNPILPVTDANFPIKLGQHVVLKIKEKSRQYTILDVGKDGSFRILFKIYPEGALTTLVDKLQVGMKVEMRGPFGNEFRLEPNQYDCLLLFAAGSGIAPFSRIISKVLENDEDDTRIVLNYSCQDEEQVMFLGKLKEWSRSWNFHVNYYFSKVIDETKAKSVHYGKKVSFKRVDKTVIEQLWKDFGRNKKTFCMICGTKSYEKDILNFLKSVDVDEGKIKTF